MTVWLRVGFERCEVEDKTGTYVGDGVDERPEGAEGGGVGGGSGGQKDQVGGWVGGKLDVEACVRGERKRVGSGDGGLGVVVGLELGHRGCWWAKRVGIEKRWLGTITVVGREDLAWCLGFVFWRVSVTL